MLNLNFFWGFTHNELIRKKKKKTTYLSPVKTFYIAYGTVSSDATHSYNVISITEGGGLNLLSLHLCVAGDAVGWRKAASDQSQKSVRTERHKIIV